MNWHIFNLIASLLALFLWRVKKSDAFKAWWDSEGVVIAIIVGSVATFILMSGLAR